MKTFLKFFLSFILVLLVSTFETNASNPSLTNEKVKVSKPVKTKPYRKDKDKKNVRIEYALHIKKSQIASKPKFVVVLV